MTIYEYLGLSKDDLQAIDVARSYSSFRIMKRDGKRTRRIDAPMPELKAIQKKLLMKVFYMFQPHNMAHGFVRNKSPRTNAECHVGRKYVIQVDIQDFFPSINQERVTQLLRYLFTKQQAFDMPTYEDAWILSNILCLNDAVPQGSPASPALTNLMCYELDRELEECQAKFKCTITRYADDIAASTDSFDDVKYILKAIKHSLLRNGFQVNGKKVKITKYSQRQQITGVVVNEKLNTPKTAWRNLRAALHQAKYKGVTEKQSQQLRGQIEWLRSLNPIRGKQFLENFGILNVQMPTESSQG